MCWRWKLSAIFASSELAAKTVSSADPKPTKPIVTASPWHTITKRFDPKGKSARRDDVAWSIPRTPDQRLLFGNLAPSNRVLVLFPVPSTAPNLLALTRRI